MENNNSCEKWKWFGFFLFFSFCDLQYLCFTFYLLLFSLFFFSHQIFHTFLKLVDINAKINTTSEKASTDQSIRQTEHYREPRIQHRKLTELLSRKYTQQYLSGLRKLE